jgi:hypothetical protein
LLESSTKTERPEAIYSLMTGGLHRPKKQTYPHLESALRYSEPSTSHDKMQNDSPDSHDPIVDHLMSSHAFKSIIWIFFLVLLAIHWAIVVLNIIDQVVDWRGVILMYGAGPIIGFVPVIAVFVLLYSRRLR